MREQFRGNIGCEQKIVSLELPVERLILFDGICVFCNSAVNFVIRRDSEALFHFASLQSELGQQCTEFFSLADLPDTFALIKNGQCFTMTDAVIEISKELSGGWPAIGIFACFPKPFRNFFYVLFGRHRYRLFGKYETCAVPTQDVRDRFLDY